MTRVQADIVPAIGDWFLAQGVSDPDAPLTVVDVRRRLPDGGWTPQAGALLMVADDGGRVRLPVKSRHTIRLTVYAEGLTEARRIVTLAAGKLVASRPRPAGVRYIDPDIGAVLEGRDEESGAMLASVMLTAVARTVEV